MKFYWEYAIPSRWYCRLLSLFKIYVICGRVTDCESKVPLKGPEAEDVQEMLRGYDLSEGARQGLLKLALDEVHGGLGNFVETLNICLNHTQGGRITEAVFQAARKYKMQY